MGAYISSRGNWGNSVLLGCTLRWGDQGSFSEAAAQPIEH